MTVLSLIHIITSDWVFGKLRNANNINRKKSRSRQFDTGNSNPCWNIVLKIPSPTIKMGITIQVDVHLTEIDLRK
jgi:hypothetical protein